MSDHLPRTACNRARRFRPALFLLTIVAFTAHAQVPDIPNVPDNIPSAARDTILSKRDQFIAQRSAFIDEATTHNTQCKQVPLHTPEAASCEVARDRLKGELAKLQVMADALTVEIGGANGMAALDRARATEPPPNRSKTYKPSGNALIGGTSWIFGYNAPPGTDPEVLKRAHTIARRLAEEEAVPYNENIAFQRYNFVLGVAASTETLQDLGSRVIFDELSAGQYTAKTQGLYSSLKGRKFGELACHSNGAMVCLAAVENRDVEAAHIVLFGPQITLESLKMWDDLVKSGRVQTLQIYINQGDPIPAASLLAGNPITLAASPLLAAPLFRAQVLKAVLGTLAPSAHVTIFACGNAPDIACHDMKRYKENRGDCLASPGRIVPGTTVPGGGGVVEPPPPC